MIVSQYDGIMNTEMTRPLYHKPIHVSKIHVIMGINS